MPRSTEDLSFYRLQWADSGAPCVTALLLDKAIVRAEGSQGSVRVGCDEKLQCFLSVTGATSNQQCRPKAIAEWGTVKFNSEEMESADLKYHTERHKEG